MTDHERRRREENAWKQKKRVSSQGWPACFAVDANERTARRRSAKPVQVRTWEVRLGSVPKRPGSLLLRQGRRLRLIVRSLAVARLLLLLLAALDEREVGFRLALRRLARRRQDGRRRAPHWLLSGSGGKCRG